MQALTLKLDAQSQGYLHSGLVNTLKAAQFLASLDAVETFLKSKCRAPFWKVVRGGHHVALVEVTPHAEVRRAMICETTDDAECFKYADVRSDIKRIESDARHSDTFLKDAPAGSGNLRTAMLEAAIRAAAFQTPVYLKGQPVVTTGMSNTMMAALAVVELGALAVEVQS